MPFPGSSTAFGGYHRSQAPFQSGYFASAASATLAISMRAPATSMALINFRHSMVHLPGIVLVDRQPRRQQLWMTNAAPAKTTDLRYRYRPMSNRRPP